MSSARQACSSGSYSWLFSFVPPPSSCSRTLANTVLWLLCSLVAIVRIRFNLANVCCLAQIVFMAVGFTWQRIVLGRHRTLMSLVERIQETTILQSKPKIWDAHVRFQIQEQKECWKDFKVCLYFCNCFLYNLPLNIFLLCADFTVASVYLSLSRFDSSHDLAAHRSQASLNANPTRTRVHLALPSSDASSTGSTHDHSTIPSYRARRRTLCSLRLSYIHEKSACGKQGKAVRRVKTGDR